ncbi:Cathepsin B-like cysteine proteinase 2 [Halotydeus destructor]|nr:Cathepsin B-like cysteine proteinase 2 [Halotydeus destructor]
MTDRCCIAAGKARPPVSTTDILTCCTSCGDGCDGGYPLRAWQYWATNGVVTGGSYGSGEGCQPYCIGPHGPDMEYGDVMKLKCRQSCENQTDKYYKSKTYGKQCKRFRESKMAAVQLDMMKNGPMTASFDVPADFLLYESGVYQPHSDDIVGGHCVTLIGWGVADGQKYWLAKNSWGTDWGEQGFFRFIRSKNVCSFEKEIECAMSDMSRGQNGGKEKSGKGKSQFPRGRGSWPKNRKRISRHS